jgi:hypothetical protein
LSRYWIGVASRDHVMRGVAGGFCQLGHGKAAPVKRLKPGDGIVYYSPREKLGAGEPLQAFTAIGEIAPGEAYVADQGGGFHPVRRDVRWHRDARDAPIRPLLEVLDLTRGKANWGVLFRRSAIAISAADFSRVALAMGVHSRAATTS